MAKPGLRGMDDPPGRFAGLDARKSADDPLPGSNLPAAKVCCGRFLRQVEEGRQRWLLRQAGQALPLRDEKDLRGPLADQWCECEGGVGCAKINTDGEAGVGLRQDLSPRSGPIPCGLGTPPSIGDWSSCASSKAQGCRAL